MSWESEWPRSGKGAHWDDYSGDKRKGKAKGHGKGHSYNPQYSSGGGKGYGKGRQSSDPMYRVAAVMEANANREFEREENEKWRLKEEADRKAKEDEAAQRKKERDEMYDRLDKIGANVDKKLEKANLKTKKSEDEEEDESKPITKKVKKEKKEDSEEEEDDWKSLLAKPKKQKVRAPIDAKAWQSWECSVPNAKIIKDRFGGAQTEYRSEGILAIAEGLAQQDTCPSKTELAKQYKTVGKKTAPARWGQLELLVGILGEICEK
jgi:hypothetical protein